MEVNIVSEDKSNAQQSGVDDSQTENIADENENNNNNNNGKDAGPLDNLTPEQLKDWGRKQAADAARYRKKLAAEKQLREQERIKEQEAQGKYKEMYETERERNQKITDSLERGVKISQLKNALLSLGCAAKMVDKAIRFADINSMESDPETYQADDQQVMFEAKRIKTEVPMFFGTSFKEANDGTPGMSKAPEKDIKKMSDEELDKAFAAALSE